MKKFLKLFSVLLVVLLFTGCSISFNLGNTVKKEKDADETEKEEKKEDSNKKSDKATCYRHHDDYTESYYMIAKKGTIYEVDFKMVYDKENDIADFTTYTDAQKQVFIDAMYEHLGVKETQEGMDVEIKITDTLEVRIDADLDKADPAKLKELGFNFDTVNRNLDKSVANFEASDYICNYN